MTNGVVTIAVSYVMTGVLWAIAAGLLVWDFVNDDPVSAAGGRTAIVLFVLGATITAVRKINDSRARTDENDRLLRMVDDLHAGDRAATVRRLERDGG